MEHKSNLRYLYDDGQITDTEFYQEKSLMNKVYKDLNIGEFVEAENTISTIPDASSSVSTNERASLLTKIQDAISNI